MNAVLGLVWGSAGHIFVSYFSAQAWWPLLSEAADLAAACLAFEHETKSADQSREIG